MWPGVRIRSSCGATLLNIQGFVIESERESMHYYSRSRSCRLGIEEEKFEMWGS